MSEPRWPPDLLRRSRAAATTCDPPGGPRSSCREGALGNESSGGPLPAVDRRFDQGAAALTYASLRHEPVTQLWRIRQAQGLRISADKGAAAERSGVEADVRFAIERLYTSVLIGGHASTRRRSR
jgi:hypothetical protein